MCYEGNVTGVNKKVSKEDEIRIDLTNLLQGELSSEERNILSNALVMLEKKEYFPKIITNLENKMTPLAIHHKLSENVSKFYLKITSHQFRSKRLGIGILTIGKMSF